MAVTKVVMPKLSEAMETGKLLRWLKQEGDRISGGDIIAEIETDKADIELEAFGSGVLRKLLATPGTAVPVGGLIAVIAEPDEDISAVVGGGAPARPARRGGARRRRPPPPAAAAPARAAAGRGAGRPPRRRPPRPRRLPARRSRWRRAPPPCSRPDGSASRRSRGSSPSGRASTSPG